MAKKALVNKANKAEVRCAGYTRCNRCSRPAPCS